MLIWVYKTKYRDLEAFHLFPKHHVINEIYSNILYCGFLSVSDMKVSTWA